MPLPRLAALAMAAAAALPAGPPAHADDLPRLAGRNLVTATGSARIDVELPGGKFVQAVDPPRSPGFGRITIADDATFGAVILESRDAAFNGGAQPYSIFQLEREAGWNCPGPMGPSQPLATGGCLDPFAFVLPATDRPGTFLGNRVEFEFPPGRYTLMLVTDPGKPVSFAFDVAGLDGAAALHATDPVRSAYEAARAADAHATVLDVEMPVELERPGFAYVGLSHMAARPDRGESVFTYAHTLTRDPPSAIGPETFLASAFVGDQSVAGQRVTSQPWSGGQSFGGVTLENSGFSTLVAPQLQSGRYLDSVRMVRAGIGPALTAWVLAVER